MNAQTIEEIGSPALQWARIPNQAMMQANTDLPSEREQNGVSSPSFLGLLLTQFLGTLNDNMFRWFVVPLGKEVIGSALALSLGLFCFTLPYPLLAARS